MNAIGQRTAVSQTGNAFAATTGWNWGYDSLGQVTTAENLTSPANHRAYAYDAIGNRLQGSAGVPPASTFTAYTSNNLNQYIAVGTVTPIHDADGNMTSGQLPTGSAGIVWDAENRLIAANITGGDTVHYIYDSQSRRIARTVGTETTLFVYDAWNVIAEYQGDASVPPAHSKSYLWGIDLSGSLQGAGGVGGLLAESQTSQSPISNVTYLPTHDGNGNVSEYLETSGTISAHFEYDPFGNTIVNTDTTNQFLCRFSTKPVDPTTGLYYYGYRYYNPTTGRWPSRDPIGEIGHEIIKIHTNNYHFYNDLYNDEGSESDNEYVFIFNSPIHTIDVNGEWAWVIPAGIAVYKIYKIYKKAKRIPRVTPKPPISKPTPPRKRGKSDPHKGEKHNPGKDKCGKCNPCKPNSPIWKANNPNGHGGNSCHQIVYNQSHDCACHPSRIDLPCPPGM